MKATGANGLAAMVLCLMGPPTLAHSDSSVRAEQAATAFYLRGSRLEANNPRRTPEPARIALLGLGLVIAGVATTRRRAPRN